MACEHEAIRMRRTRYVNSLPSRAGMTSSRSGALLKEPLNKSPMERVCREMRMMARRATKVVARPRSGGAGAPLGMRPWSGMRCPERGLSRRPSLPDPPCGGPAGCGCGRPLRCRGARPASAAFRANPRGRGFRAPGIVARLADIPDIGCTSLRAMHPGKPPSRPS